jgi:hypothetical protein
MKLKELLESDYDYDNMDVKKFEQLRSWLLKLKREWTFIKYFNLDPYTKGMKVKIAVQAGNRMPYYYFIKNLSKIKTYEALEKKFVALTEKNPPV